MEKTTDRKSDFFEFELLGQKLTLRSQENPEIIKEALELAKLKVKDAEKRIRLGAAHQVALIALLDLAEDYVRARKRASEHRRLVEEKTTRLVSLLDAELSL